MTTPQQPPPTTSTSTSPSPTPAARYGRVGIWSGVLRSDDESRRGEITEAAAELDELGYGTLWLGGNPGVEHAARVLAATKRVRVATGILSIWQHEAAAVAAQTAEVNAAHDGRFTLGLGVSHAVLADQYRRPYSAMVAYLDALDAAAPSVPPTDRVLAALGPRMLKLSRDRAAGAHPYLVTPEHTATARTTLGPDRLLAPELKVVLDPDLPRARETARGYLVHYLALPNYTASLTRLGFTDADYADGGSDRLIDATFALGSAEAIRARADEFFAAGADHLAVQVVTAHTGEDLPREEWRTLASALPLTSS
ncbi:TIGR03620 family F420-dependent LLM class oxidoreductase [Streptomyces sp. A7024]|uniref:TIGR03620 family F420-dependent LLM class oxidoreductase n=1 Tax=Streptomyces coryli TaxID=1128680 RepID=A0A6G4U5Q3_9ACTN|nr:TIGR03620 family F420-dependent LLM class oxidoreductase [Streptomyces coryli]NGN66531.1 TIGR03620 family F420-dependent LLM class oxidoreductase [Streptomyces coryli]